MSAPQSDWIKLSERMPENFKYCWWYGFNTIPGYAVPTLTTRSLNDGQTRPAGVMVGATILSFDQFTHWQYLELPPPPEKPKQADFKGRKR